MTFPFSGWARVVIGLPRRSWGKVVRRSGWRPLTCAGAIFWPWGPVDRHWFIHVVCYRYEFGLSCYLYLATFWPYPSFRIDPIPSRA